MDRWTRNQIITSFNNYQNNELWQQQPPPNQSSINTLSILYKNLYRYEKAYRRYRSRQAIPNQKKQKQYLEHKINKNRLVSQNSRSLKKIRSHKKSKNFSSNDIENINYNIHQKFTRPNLDINIKNVQFDKSQQGYKKKKDRYRQIFGQKPRYILKKVRTQSFNIR